VPTLGALTRTKREERREERRERRKVCGNEMQELYQVFAKRLEWAL
jgi:hypothetical protein